MEIKVNNLNFYYNKKSGVKILDLINFKVPNNSIVGITGKSGSGKTTLAQLICGINIPSSGKITVDDIVINKKNIFDEKQLKNKIGYIAQNSENQLFNKTVKDELTYILKFLGKSIDENKIIEVLNAVGLDESYLNSNPLLLSTGERKKVSIASTLALDTDIVIFDEPTKGLDSKSIKSLKRLIKNLKSNFGKTIIIISRDVEFIHALSDEVIVMNDGKILIWGNKYEVFKTTDLLRDYCLPIPKTMEFSSIVLDKKNIKIGYRDEINDLLKDIYRYVR
ncbi:MAG: ATP-binding cassette domain-containing protein [Bacilli bacterium]|nr:ATP-binding cassette domain-containing protein [Bacilli bacterium]